jgi:hypothetical protein
MRPDLMCECQHQRSGHGEGQGLPKGCLVTLAWGQKCPCPEFVAEQIPDPRFPRRTWRPA